MSSPHLKATAAWLMCFSNIIRETIPTVPFHQTEHLPYTTCCVFITSCHHNNNIYKMPWNVIPDYCRYSRYRDYNISEKHLKLHFSYDILSISKGKSHRSGSTLRVLTIYAALSGKPSIIVSSWRLFLFPFKDCIAQSNQGAMNIPI